MSNEKKVFQITQIDSELFEGINLILKDIEGVILGGIVGKVEDSQAHIEHLWIDEAYRGQDLGTNLLQNFEKIAQAQGCEKVLVDTFDFQAPTFYQKNGYKIIHTLSQEYANYTRFYFCKLL